MTEDGADPGSSAFRRAIGMFATGVTVVAVDTPHGVQGMTANAVCSVSLDPLLLLVCVGRQARLAQWLVEGASFTLNMLRDDQEALSRFFSGDWPAPHPPEFRFEPWGDAPRLTAVLASVRCTVDRRDEGGDHWIIIGRVRALHEDANPGHPLVFFAGRYRRLAPLRVSVKPPEARGPDGVSIFYEDWTATHSGAIRTEKLTE